MKIAVVDLISKDGGALTITKSFFDYIAEGNDLDNDWIFVLSDQPLLETQYVRIVRFPDVRNGYFSRAKTELIEVNRFLKEERIDVVICMSNMGVLGCCIDQYVYLQQSIPFQKEKRFSIFKPEEREHALRQYIQGALIKKSIKKSKMVFVQTDWMKNAVGESVKNVPIVNVGYPIQTRMSYTKKPKNVGTDFFYPCGPAFYKNLSIIVDAVDILNKEGYSFSFYITLTKEELRALSKRDIIDYSTIICMGKIPHEMVEDLYCKTTLVFSSYIETLGLPLVEAREIGTWIIASDCAFSHEVLDEYPNKDYFDPFEVNQLVVKMKRVLDGKALLNTQLGINASDKRNTCWNSIISCITNCEKVQDDN